MNDALNFKWTVSRGRDTYGYNICTLYVNGQKVSRCNGGSYDMQGTCLGTYIAQAYANRLVTLPVSAFEDHTRNGEDVTELYGLTFHDPNFDPSNAVIPKRELLSTKNTGEYWTVAEAEAANQSLGLERYQQFYKASSNTPTEQYTVPLIDGACGRSSVEIIMRAIGLTLEYVRTPSKRQDTYLLHDERQSRVNHEYR